MDNKKRKQIDRAHETINYDERLRHMLNDAFVIGSNAMWQARQLVEKYQKKDVAGWMHIAERAIGEIIRLSPMLEPDYEQQPIEQTIGWKHDPELEKELSELIPNA